MPACVYVEKRGKQSTEITRRSIDTPNSPWPQSGLHSADLTGKILKMKLPQMPGQFGILVNRPALSRRPFVLATFSVRATKPSDASSRGIGGEREVVILERLLRWEASACRAPAHAAHRGRRAGPPPGSRHTWRSSSSRLFRSITTVRMLSLSTSMGRRPNASNAFSFSESASRRARRRRTRRRPSPASR